MRSLHVFLTTIAFTGLSWPLAALASPSAVSAVDERSSYVNALRSSGPADVGLSARAVHVHKDWSRSARKLRERAALGALECFQGGCVVTVRLKSRGDFDPIADQLARSSAFRTWAGPRWRSGPITEGAHTEMTWILWERRPPEAGVTGTAPAPGVARDESPSKG
jgi:hypothetical protein